MKRRELSGWAGLFLLAMTMLVYAKPELYVTSFYEEFDADPFPPDQWAVQGTATQTTCYALSAPNSVLLASHGAALDTPAMLATGRVFTCRYLNGKPGDMLRIDYSTDRGNTWTFYRKYSASPNYWALITIDLETLIHRTARQDYIDNTVKLRLSWDIYNDTNSIVCVDNCRLAEKTRAITAPADFDGDGKSDLAAYYPETGLWAVLRSSDTQLVTRNWGWSAAIPVAADYDGDGIADQAVFAEGWWYINGSVQGPMAPINYGFGGCIPIPADFEGDGSADLVLYYPPTGTWFVKFLSSILDEETATPDGDTEAKNWGFAGTYPVPADYDGDNIADLCVYSPQYGCWYFLLSEGDYTNSQFVHWGWDEMIPLTPDAEGEGRVTLGGYYPDAGAWLAYDRGLIANWGWSQALPMLGDYDGDGITDLAVANNANDRLSMLVYYSSTGPQEAVIFNHPDLTPVSGAPCYIYRSDM